MPEVRCIYVTYVTDVVKERRHVVTLVCSFKLS